MCPSESWNVSSANMENEALEVYVERVMRGWKEFFFDAFTALRVNGITGDYAEFGSQSGSSMAIAHAEIEFSSVDRHMWAFDSFEGLPETAEPRDVHPSFIRGGGGDGKEGFISALDGYGVPAEAYTIVEGYYDQTLPVIGDGPPTDIALAYIDCNLYSSTVTVLDFLEPRLKHGMILAFDDWFCWSPTDVSGEQTALTEFARRRNDLHFEPFKQISWSGQSFVVQRPRTSHAM